MIKLIYGVPNSYHSQTGILFKVSPYQVDTIINKPEQRILFYTGNVHYLVDIRIEKTTEGFAAIITPYVGGEKNQEIEKMFDTHKNGRITERIEEMVRHSAFKKYNLFLFDMLSLSFVTLNDFREDFPFFTDRNTHLPVFIVEKPLDGFFSTQKSVFVYELSEKREKALEELLVLNLLCNMKNMIKSTYEDNITTHSVMFVGILSALLNGLSNKEFLECVDKSSTNDTSMLEYINYRVRGYKSPITMEVPGKDTEIMSLFNNAGPPALDDKAVKDIIAFNNGGLRLSELAKSGFKYYYIGSLGKRIDVLIDMVVPGLKKVYITNGAVFIELLSSYGGVRDNMEIVKTMKELLNTNEVFTVSYMH